MFAPFRCVHIALVSLLLVIPSFSPAAEGPPDRLVETARTTSKPVVVDFGKGLCVQCIKQAEAIEEAKAAIGDKVGFEFVHVIKEPSLSGQYQVFMIPTLVFLDSSGKEVYRYVGLLETNELMDKINELWL